MKRLRQMLFVVFTVAGWLALQPAPYTMRVIDETGRGAAGVRIITDNGIVCFTLLDGTVSWSERSLLRRPVQIDLHDDHHRYADASASVPFDSGGHGTVILRRIAPAL